MVSVDGSFNSTNSHSIHCMDSEMRAEYSGDKDSWLFPPSIFSAHWKMLELPQDCFGVSIHLILAFWAFFQRIMFNSGHHVFLPKFGFLLFPQLSQQHPLCLNQRLHYHHPPLRCLPADIQSAGMCILLFSFRFAFSNPPAVNPGAREASSLVRL